MDWMAQYPETATAVGYPGQNARWTDYSQPSDRGSRGPLEKTAFSGLTDIDRARPGPPRIRSATICIGLLQTAASGSISTTTPAIRGVVPHNLSMPINQLEGVQQDVPRRSRRCPATRGDYRNIVGRLEEGGPLVDQTIALMERACRPV